MTKIYVVKAINLKSDHSVVSEVFTNKEKAQAFAKYFNAGNEDYHYIVMEREICKEDYRGLLKLSL